MAVIDNNSLPTNAAKPDVTGAATLADVDGGHLNVATIGKTCSQFLNGEVSKQDFMEQMKTELTFYLGRPASEADITAKLNDLSSDIVRAMPGAETNLFKATLEKLIQAESVW